MAPVCYAQRLLNPFRGVMNIIEYQGAEAVTTDGAHWDIYVRDTRLVEGLANAHKVQTSDIRYGSWSDKQGLKRGAIYPSEDFRMLEHRGALVYEYLLGHCADIPFPFHDRYELWLLDGAGEPLALLDSVNREQDIEQDRPIEWRAGRECRRHFRSATVRGAEGMMQSAGEQLEKLVNERAGRSPRAQWFRRDADGSGAGLGGINLADGAATRRLPGSAFAEFFLSLPVDNPGEQRLVREFHAWQAPCLLLLQGLDDATRARLEQQAVARARAVEQHCRLYPSVIDVEAIRAARVEALLRACEPSTDDEGEAMATYYIELNVTRTN
jgi:hypothetical protein